MAPYICDYYTQCPKSIATRTSRLLYPRSVDYFDQKVAVIIHNIRILLPLECCGYYTPVPDDITTRVIIPKMCMLLPPERYGHYNQGPYIITTRKLRLSYSRTVRLLAPEKSWYYTPYLNIIVISKKVVNIDTYRTNVQ